MNNILIVCSGNICRSPIAHALFEKHMPSLNIDSAGVFVDRHQLSGVHPVTNSQSVAKQNGLDISRLQAQQLTPELVSQHDLILVMTHEHIEQVAQVSQGARAKTLLIGQWIGVGEVHDPIGQEMEVFEQCFSVLERAVLSWKSRLKA
ncbi:phosphotyrosine protein phosphatase [Vibrio tubiashii]|nr:phosphotyrosine protein phosphatase [Vibrio tubiashii]